MPYPAKVNHVIDQLRGLVESGEYGRSGKLPGRKTLAKSLGVSTETLGKAINHLKAEGVLAEEGRGVVVNTPKMRVPGVVPSFDGHLREQGLEPHFEYLNEPEIIDLTPDLAEMFKLEEGTKVVKRVRKQGTKQTPYRLAETYYLWSLIGDDLLERMRKEPELVVTKVIEERTGKRYTHAHEEIIVRFPSSREQEILNIPRQAPVIDMVRICRSDDETIIMFNHIVLVASFFRLEYDYATHTAK